jgi:hypothetical protein
MTEYSPSAADSAILADAQRWINRRKGATIVAASSTPARPIRDVNRRSAHTPRPDPPAAAEFEDPAAEVVEFSNTHELDPMSTLVPPGQYVLTFVSEARQRIFKREIWFVVMQILAGDHAGKRLLRFYNIPARGRFLARSSNLSRDFIALTKRRPPSKGFRPSDLLRGVQVEARVVTVSDRAPTSVERESFRSSGQKVPSHLELPAATHYSKVAALESLVAGWPRILGTRHVQL